MSPESLPHQQNSTSTTWTDWMLSFLGLSSFLTHHTQATGSMMFIMMNILEVLR